MNLVTLIDGRQVPNGSEEWRHECEARAVCRMGGYWLVDRNSGRRTWIKATGVRRQYIERVREKRGGLAADALAEMVLQVWNAEFRTSGE